MPEEKVDLEKDEGVRIGDVLSFIRTTKAVTVMGKRKGQKDFTTIEMKFDEHYTGVKLMPMQQLVEDGYGNVNVRTIRSQPELRKTQGQMVRVLQRSVKCPNFRQ